MRLGRGDAERAIRAERDALAEENARLRRSVAELAVLKEVARALSEAVGAEHGKIVLYEGQPDGAAGGGRTLVQTGAFTTLGDVPLPDEFLFGLIARRGDPYLHNSPHTDEHLKRAGLPAVVRSLVIVPMSARGRLVGMLCL